MEEQMICGALELLNDEAKEDARKGEESSSTLSPINSEPEPQNYEHRKSSKAYLSQDETDVLYVMGTSLNMTAELPDSPSVVRKLEEAEAKYFFQNETQNQRIHHVRSLGSTSAISDPITIPAGLSPGKKIRQSSLSRNATHSGNVTMGSSPLKSKSLGAKDYKPQVHQRNKSPGKGCRKSASQHLQNLERDSSTDASSDESQKPLVMKPLASDKHSRRVTTSRSPRPPLDPSSSPKKKRVAREDSIASKFSRMKSSIFGQSTDPNTSTSVNQRREYRPVRYDLPTEDSSEPSQYFKEHGHPWTAYRAPTPLPPFGTDEYYQVIKSSNPSPTTSNESELGSTPEDISSREELFLPGPPDLPESPYPRRSHPENESLIRNENIIEIVPHRPTPGVPTSIPTSGSSFVPITAPQAHRIYDPLPSRNGSAMSQKSKSIRRITVASAGEDAVGQPRRLTRTSMNQSDPVLSPSFSRIDSDHQIGSETISVHSHPLQQEVTNPGSQSLDQSQRVGSPPLIRQAAIIDTNSSRENTPQK